MQPSNHTAKPELLAPAGSLEAFFAAMDAGADAVYVGLKEFSARAKAKNFSLADLEKMLAYAHRQDRKIFVTLNTLVKQAELPQLVEALAGLEELGADALILQDLSVWRLARRHFPNLPLHASTQMTVHNAAGVRMLERMGFQRAVLARELSLEEIGAIRAQTSLELEHFIHGALCFSFSGQCYFSSYLGGKSGNRGRCAQPCRRRYQQRNREGYFFSPNDLSAIDLLDELAAAGICSFKIEGRMKSAEYVFNVVSAYRTVLDAAKHQRIARIAEAKELLREAFGRPPTRGFLPGGVPQDIALPGIRGATGRLLGEVARVEGKVISFKSRGELQVGDRLRIQPQSDRPGTAFTIRELYLGRKSVMQAQGGSFVRVPSPFDGVFQAGDGIFKVSSREAYTLSENACRKRLEQVQQEGLPIRLHAGMPDNATLSLTAEFPGGTEEFRFPVDTFPAETNPLSASTLTGVFQKTAGEPFVLDGLTAGTLPPLVIPPSRLKQIRREFYAGLRKKLETHRMPAARSGRRAALTELKDAETRRPQEEARLTVGIANARDLHILNHPEVDRVMLPLVPGNVEAVLQSRRGATQAESIVWDVPMIRLEPEWQASSELIRRLAERGFTRFRLNNLGHLPLFDELPQTKLSGSYRLFILNSQAALAWKELGLAEGMLYVEDDRRNLADLLAVETGLDYDLTLYASIPLLTSRIPLPAIKTEAPILSDRDEAFHVAQRSGLSVLSSGSDFSLTQFRDDLTRLGCRHFTLDLSHLGPFSEAGKRVMEAFRSRSPLSGTSVFNYEHGLE